MSEPEIIEAVDTRNELNSEKDAQMPMDKEQKEIDISRAMPKMLAEVEEVVDELHTLRHAFSNGLWVDVRHELPDSLSRRIPELLSQEGLKEMPQEIRQEARLRILEALSLCLEHATYVKFMDKELIGESELSASEVEALYRRLESSTALECVNFFPPYASEDWGPESWRLFEDILLGAQSLRSLEVTLEQPLSGPPPPLSVVASGRGPSPVNWVRVTHGYRKHQRSGGSKGSVTAEWAEIVANYLNVAAPNLKELSIVTGPHADEDVAELIGEAVVWLQSLENLTMVDFYGGGDCDSGERESDAEGTSVLRSSLGKKKIADRLLSRAFLGNACNTSLKTLNVFFRQYGASSMPGRYLQVLCQVLQMHTNITRLGLSWLDNLLARDLRDFLKTLPVNGVNLQSLELTHWTTRRGLPEDGGPEGFGFEPESFSILVEILKSNSMPGLKHLTLEMDINEGLDWPGLYSSLAQMESVSVTAYVGLCQAEREVMEWIQTSEALQKLVLLPEKDSEVKWSSIFHCLRENNNIRHLTVRGDTLKDDGAYRELMEVLQVNSTLQEVEFEGSDSNSSRTAAVQEALKGTARQESYLAELQRGLGGGRGNWQSPKCGRVFLKDTSYPYNAQDGQRTIVGQETITK